MRALRKSVRTSSHPLRRQAVTARTCRRDGGLDQETRMVLPTRRGAVPRKQIPDARALRSPTRFSRTAESLRKKLTFAAVAPGSSGPNETEANSCLVGDVSATSPLGCLGTTTSASFERHGRTVASLTAPGPLPQAAKGRTESVSAPSARKRMRSMIRVSGDDRSRAEALCPATERGALSASC